MKIAFILPPISRNISGGTKVIYTYAKYLSNQNNRITINYLLNSGINQKHIPAFLAIMIRKALTVKEPSWYKLPSSVRKVASDEIQKIVQKNDIVVATSVMTAHEIYKAIGEKYLNKIVYLIQDYENWGVTDEYVIGSYRMGYHNVAVSKWLCEIVTNASGEPCELMQNGINLEVFHREIDSSGRQPHTIAMLWHDNKRKGCSFGLEAIYSLKDKYPDLEVYMFGSPRRPVSFPEWIHYTEKASQNEVSHILNIASVYMCSSLVEGYGLPGIEAMACGCALVTTDCKGIKEYAQDGVNCFMCKTGDSKALYDGVLRAFENRKLVDNLIENSSKTIIKYDLKLQLEKFQEYIKKIIE